MATLTSARRIRYAVVGLGNIAQEAMLPAFAHAKTNSELVALVSSDREKLERVASGYAISSKGTYDELERVLADAHVDAAYIAVPNSLHRVFTERCARVGVHVLCEKPMAITGDDCEAMIDACEAGRVKLMIAYRLHFEEANLRAMEIVRSGDLGVLRLFDALFTQQVRRGDIRTRSELGGGALYDMGIYCLNAARYIFGDEPSAVIAEQVYGADERFREVDEMTTATLRFPDERIAQFTASQGAAPLDCYRVLGTLGELRVEPAFTYLGERKHHLTIGGRTKDSTFARRDQFAPELVYFSSCVLAGREPEPSGHEGLADVRAMEAIVESARSGRMMPIDVPRRSRRPALGMEMRMPPVRRPKVVNAPPPSTR